MTISAIRSKTGLFGFRLEQPWAISWLLWLKLRGQWLLTWLTPAAPVRLLHPDGTQSIWVGSKPVPQGARIKAPKFLAVEIPDDLLLHRNLVLPKMSDAHIQDAILLEVRSNSPFAPEDLGWGFAMREASHGQRQVDVVIASRRQISGFIQNRWPDLGIEAQQPEVWALGDLPAPVPIAGFGEVRRLQDAALQRRWNWALLVLACLLAILAAITPTAQLRWRAIEAVSSFQAVSARTAPLVRKRDELFLLNDRLRSLDSAVAERVNPAAVMEYLTQALPDDTFLYSLDLQKSKITASGHTVDASALLQKLSADSRLRDVRSPTAVTRLPGAAKEAFTVEFIFNARPPSVSPVPVATVGATVPPPPVAAARAARATTASPIAAASAVPASPAVPGVAAAAPAPARPASATPGSSPFVIGGSK